MLLFPKVSSLQVQRWCLLGSSEIPPAPMRWEKANLGSFIWGRKNWELGNMSVGTTLVIIELKALVRDMGGVTISFLEENE